MGNKGIVREEAEKLFLQGKDIQVMFTSENRLSFNFLGDKQTNYLVLSDRIDMLWRAAFLKEDGTSPVYNSNNSVYTGYTIKENSTGRGEIDFAWKIKLDNEQWGEFILNISLEAGSNLTFWKCTVHLPSEWRLSVLEFPIISNLSYEAASRFLAPSGWGTLHAFREGCFYKGAYPSWEATLQVIALCSEKRGLYIGAHDSQANLKTLLLEGREDKALFSMELPLSLENEGGGVFEMPFPFILGIFEGGYEQVGHIYREFTMQTPWGSVERMDQRKDVPEWTKETCLWLRPDGTPEENIDVTEQALAFFDVPVALHWYRWHTIPYDTHYPEYFPPHKGFLDAIMKFKEKGARVLCYINSRLWDPDSTSWKSKKAYTEAARTKEGTLYSEIYGSMIPNNVMCPTSPLWQETIASIVHVLLSEYKLDGVYLDQIAAGAGVPCYADNHPHKPGGGTFWRDGYCALLDRVHSVMSDNHILVTEENAECWLDRIEVHLNVNTPVYDCVPVPLYPIIYSDRSLIYGSFYFARSEPGEDYISFRYKHAWALLWGSQPGFIQPARIMDPSCRKEAEFLRNCVRVRHRAQKWLVGGRFWGMLDVGGDNPLIHQKAMGPFGGEWTIREKGVLSSFWTSPEGKACLLLTNITDDEHEVHISLQDVLKKMGTTINSCMVFSGVVNREKEISLSAEELRLNIAARDALFIQVPGSI